jgi:ABC-2 type transport system permease protein
MARSARNQSLLQFALFCGIVLFVNVLANTFHTYFDLTEEKRFTLTKPTRNLLKGLDERVYVQVLLEGEFPAGFKRLKTATREILDDFRGLSGYIEYQFEDPNTGTTSEINERREALANEGIAPTALSIAEEGERSQKLIYPVAIVHYANRRLPVKLLENESPTLSPDEVINNSVSLLEYKLANAIKKIRAPKKPVVLFTKGHGELDDLQTMDLERSLRQFYETARVGLDSVVQIPPDRCALLVVAKPRSAFSEKDKFKIDQYIMNGGKTLWLIDALGVNLDSLRTGTYLPEPYTLNLDDMLFKYGIRIQPDLVIDLECSKIPLRVGQAGDGAQLKLFKWYYHPTIQSKSKHPIVKNLDRVELQFCSSIDTIRTKTPVQKTTILNSSPYSRLQFSPVEVSFEMLRDNPDPAKFNKGLQPLGVLLEGVFSSNYENRVSEEMQVGLQQAGISYRNTSVATRMVVISDGDVAANFVRDPNAQQGATRPLGYNRFENSQYANKELLMNTIEYLVQAEGVIEARNKEVKLRLLDNVKAKREKTQWQLINIVLPLVLLGLFGALFMWFRRRKYAK